MKKLPTTNISLTVVKRTNDWQCFLTGNRKVWESGKSKAEAIGQMIITLSAANDAIEIKER